jgi:hypothetical protein
MNFCRVYLKFAIATMFLFVLTISSAQNLADFKEDGSTGSCGWAKQDKNGKTLPISIYASPNDSSPSKTINHDSNYYWVVEKKGTWVKLRATGGPQFLNGPLVGWVKISQLQLGAFRNCN